MDRLSPKEKRYVHAKSLLNFIKHVNELHEDDRQKCEDLLSDYLDQIKAEENIEASLSTDFFQHYINPLGMLYSQIGFKRHLSLRYSISFSIIADLLIWFLFFKFPFPIATLVLLVNRLVRYRKDTSKRYGFFY